MPRWPKRGARSPEPVIRPIVREDLEDCARLFVQVFAEPPYRESWSVRPALDYLDRFWGFDPDHCLLALDGEEVIGAMFGYCYPWQDRVNYYIQEFFVRAGRRRSGHGRRLVRHLLDTLGEANVSISLIANEATPAAAFYEDLGLRQHRYFKFYAGMAGAEGIRR